MGNQGADAEASGLDDGSLADVEGEEGLRLRGHVGGGVEGLLAAHAERYGVGAAESLGFGHGVVSIRGNFDEITGAHIGIHLNDGVARVEFDDDGGQAYGFQDGDYVCVKSKAGFFYLGPWPVSVEWTGSFFQR